MFSTPIDAGVTSPSYSAPSSLGKKQAQHPIDSMAFAMYLTSSSQSPSLTDMTKAGRPTSFCNFMTFSTYLTIRPTSTGSSLAIETYLTNSSRVSVRLSLGAAFPSARPISPRRPSTRPSSGSPPPSRPPSWGP